MCKRTENALLLVNDLTETAKQTRLVGEMLVMKWTFSQYMTTVYSNNLKLNTALISVPSNTPTKFKA